VFWGVAVIGGTGMLLWWPHAFHALLPGWAINVATTIHSDEALLAVGFIFTVHFLNTHFRPEKFPIDTVVFTGGVPLEGVQAGPAQGISGDGGRGELDQNLMPAPSPWRPSCGAVLASRSRHRPDTHRSDRLRNDLRIPVASPRKTLFFSFETYKNTSSVKKTGLEIHLDVRSDMWKCFRGFQWSCWPPGAWVHTPANNAAALYPRRSRSSAGPEGFTWLPAWRLRNPRRSSK